MYLSRDPWEGNFLRPGSMNGWGYVEGDPVNSVDPTGMWCTDCGFGSIARVNADLGANLRSIPHSSGRILTTLSKATNVFVIFPQSYWGDGRAWRFVGVPWRTSETKGFVADEFIDWVCKVWEPNCPPSESQPPEPPPGPVERLTQLPVDSPSYDNGYGVYGWGPHDGYDITSQSGNQTVYSMGAGTVDSMDTPNMPGVTCSCSGASTDYFLIRIKMAGRNLYIKPRPGHRKR